RVENFARKITPDITKAGARAVEPVVEAGLVEADGPRPSGLDRRHGACLMRRKRLPVEYSALQTGHRGRIEPVELEAVIKRDADVLKLAREADLVVADRDVLECLPQFLEEQQFVRRLGIGTADRTHRFARLQLRVRVAPIL